MSDKSAIEWTEATWNPVTGCSKVSPGCAHCYIERTPAFRIHGRRFVAGATDVRLHPDRIAMPLHWRRPRMIFVNSLSDLFHENVPDPFIDRIFGVMAGAPQHTFQVLTKRPERMREYLSSEDARWCIAAAAARYAGRVDLAWSPEAMPWPLPNVWLGVSIENRRFVHRADLLRETPAAVRFISAEPLLGPLLKDGGDIYPTGVAPPPDATLPGEAWADGYDGPELNLFDIDWLIVGGESGPDYRPVRAEWIRSLRDACRQDDVAFFFKQFGGRTPKAGGRELDGRTWDELPTTATEATAA